MTLRPDQKFFEYIIGLFWKFFKAAELMLHSFAGSLATIQLSLEPAEHRRFTVVRVIHTLPRCTATPCGSIHRACFEIAVGYSLEGRCIWRKKVVHDEDGNTRLKEKRWQVGCAHHARSCTDLPVHIVHFLAEVDKNETLFEKCAHIHFSQRSDKWRRRF